MGRDIDKLLFLTRKRAKFKLIKQYLRKAPAHYWERTNNSRVRFNTDNADSFQGKMFVIIRNSFSKCFEVIPINNTSSKSTIKALQHCFTTHGYPQVIISDNGPVFTSDEFAFFCCETSEMKHIKSAPFHPATNGCAEKAVRTFKVTMKKLKDIQSMSERLRTFLFQYCITPLSITGKSPVELFMNRKLNNKLNVMKPDEDSSEVNRSLNS